jgi:type IV pilus assembly protein PilB
MNVTPIGKILLLTGVIKEEDLDRALSLQREMNLPLGEVLVRMGVCTEDDILRALSKQAGIDFVEGDVVDLDHRAVRLVPLDFMKKFGVVTSGFDGSSIIAVTYNPISRDEIAKQIRMLTGRDVKIICMRRSAVETAISMVDLETGDGDEEVVVERIVEDEDLEMRGEEPPVVRMVNQILARAADTGASDVHIEPMDTHVRVRLRIDGILHDFLRIPLRMKAGIVARVKILSGMDIAERRIPQDGRFRFRTRGRDIDVRVSTLPGIHGEKIVMRLLDRENLFLDLTKLGFEEESLKVFEEALEKPWGMVLVTGPTGSGKTNTLYSAVSKLNKEGVNILTVEDPVEFEIKGITQVNVNEAQGLTFAAALRSFLRQDPNIILVGEIRDLETAQIAIKASLTGHLVLSTLHTNDAPSAITRLVEMGVEPYIVATSLLCVVAQRLVRKICPSCRERAHVPEAVLRRMGFNGEIPEVYRGRGCRECRGTGYRGRTGLFEVIGITDGIRELIYAGANASEIRRKAIEEGAITLRQSGLIKISKGITTVEEVLRETVL